jgi:pimeloyl-ACP methyl ester carboxylesterase
MHLLRLKLLGGLAALTLMSFGCGEGMRAGWKSDFVESNGIRLHYWRIGAGDGSDNPVIVAIHGITDSGACWSSLAVELSGHYDLVLYDARGHGLSDKPDSGYDIETHAADLAGLVDGLGLEQPILVGHSMGGAIAAVAAAKNPKLTRAMVLIDPAWLRTPAKGAASTEEFRQWLESVNSQDVGDLMDVVQDDNPEWPFEDWKPWAESKTQVSPRVVETYRDLPALENYFPQVQTPTLIIKADAEESERREHLESASLLASGKLIHMDGAGHSVHRDRPRETRSAIFGFLRSLRLWELTAKYQEAGGYQLQLVTESWNRKTREESKHRLQATWKVDAANPGGGAFEFTAEDGAVNPSEWEDPLEPKWLELHRAGHRVTEVRNRGTSTVERNDEDIECRNLSGRFSDGKPIRYWYDEETGFVRQIVVQGMTRWTIYVDATSLAESDS